MGFLSHELAINHDLKLGGNAACFRVMKAACSKKLIKIAHISVQRDQLGESFY